MANKAEAMAEKFTRDPATGTYYIGKGNQPPPGDGGGGTIDDMEARLKTVEQAIVRIDATLPTLATKADLLGEVGSLRAEVHKGFADQTKWIIGTAFAGIAVFITVMTFVLNNAVPKAPAPAAPQPTVIVVPALAAPVAPAAPASK